MLEGLREVLFAGGLVLLVLLAWTRVQALVHRFATRHPEFGPARDEGGGCSGNCSCSGGGCTSHPEIELKELDR